jgi:tetratricopeptide (TPR) repeat protein
LRFEKWYILSAFMSSAVEKIRKSVPALQLLDICLIFLLFAATLTAYWPALRGGILWDDDAHITRPGLQSIGGLVRIWFQPGATQQYYPVVHTAFWVEHLLWRDSTAGYHITNIVLHVLAACLFALVLSQLSIRGAWIGAFIFALHPVAVESVAWISEQKNTLSTVFYLLAMLLYLRYDELRAVIEPDNADTVYPRPDLFAQIPEYYIALVFFVAAILSKSVTATLPAALLVIFWWKRGKLSWNRDVFPLLPWFGIGIVGGLFTAWIEWRYVGAAGQNFSLSPLQRVLIAGRDIWFYLQKLVWPSNLMFVYPRWDVSAAGWWQYLFPAGAIVLVTIAWLVRRKTRSPLAAVLFFIGSLFPALGFFNVYPFIYSFVADHFQYLASLGIIALVASLCRDKLTTAAAVAVIAVLAVITRIDAANYRDAETLYRTTSARNPRCWMCYNNLGAVLFAQGKVSEATDFYIQALRIKRDYAEATNNLGVMLTSRGLVAAAQVKFQEALRMKPNYADALNNLGNALLLMGRVDEAMPNIQKALEIRPDYPEAKLNMGAAMLKMNRTADAIDDLKDAIRLKPNYAEAHGVLGVAWFSAGQFGEAKTEFEQALRLKPAYVQTYNNYAETLWNLGQLDEALPQFEAALRLDPQNVDAHLGVAKVYAAKGRPIEASTEYEQVLKANPEMATAHNDFALVLEALKKTDDAVKHFNEAIRLKPDFADAHYNFALLLISMHRKADGVSELKAALKYAPNMPEAHDALGAALYDSGQFSQALAEFTEAQRLKPDLPGIQNNLELARRASSKGK